MLPQQREHGGHLGIVSLPFFGVPYLLPVDQKHHCSCFSTSFRGSTPEEASMSSWSLLTFKKIVLSIKIYRKDV